jgi:outer membrane protein assembly factor BamA
VQLEQDARRLEEFYRKEGYPRPHVTVEVARSKAALQSLPLLGLQTASPAGPDDDELFVRFRIKEGHREQVAAVEVSFNGPHSQSEAQVRKVLGLRPGNPYTPEALEADKQRLGQLFSSVGHPYAEIDPTSSTWDPEHTRVVIRWVIDEGELVRFGQILIRGNFVTRESVIRRDLPFRTGDPYNGYKLLEAQQNLIGRQIFTSVRVVPKPGETDEFRIEAAQKHWPLRRNPIPILVEVTERYDSLGEVGIFVGVSTDNPLYSTAAYTWRNVAGLGADFEVRGELGVRIQSLLVRLAQPRLGIPFLRLSVAGFWRNENTYSVGLLNSYGANAELSRSFAPIDEQGRRLPPTLRLYTRFEFNFSQILVPLLRPEGTTGIPVDGDRTQSLKLSFGVVWDRRVGIEAPAFRQRNLPVPPNPLMPVEGFLLSAQITGAMCCAFAPFSAQGSFLAFATQAVLLKPFGDELRPQDGWPFGMRRFNLKMNLRINYGIPLFRPALPVVERYFAGGDTSVRGYDADLLRAEEVRAPIGALTGEPGYRIVPQGGSVRILSQIEWVFAITPKLFGWPWVGALFVDTGAVFDGWEKLRWNDVRFSVGASLLRLWTQFGELSLDYAYPLTLPGQDPLLQSERWKHEPWYQHFPGRIHFNWGMPISL